jgi:hypothetical protein
MAIILAPGLSLFTIAGCVSSEKKVKSKSLDEIKIRAFVEPSKVLGMQPIRIVSF